MAYNFDKKAELGKYEVHVDTAANYGYMENVKSGGEGGLWFGPREGHPEQQEVVDYDGFFVIPKAVADQLKAWGYHVDDSCLADPN